MTETRELPDVSVVVPTHGRPDRVLDLVRTVLQERDLHQLVIAVDGPDPRLERQLAEVADDRLLVVALPENVGQAGAREAGARAASGEVVLLVDDDVVLEPGTVLGHAQAHAGEPDLVVVGHNPVALPPRRQPGMAATYLYAVEYDRAWADCLADESLVLDRLWAGHLSLRRDHYLATAGQEWPVRYHEDQDLGRRMTEAGLRGRAVPELRSRHLHSRTFEQSVEESRRQGEALALLARRWPERPLPDYATRPGPLGVLRALSGARLGRAVVAVARAVARAAGALHLWSVETAALRLARQTTLRRALRQSTG